MRNIKPTTVPECDECSRKFQSGEVVFYLVWDGTIVCTDCCDSILTLQSVEKEERVYRKTSEKTEGIT